MWKSIPKRPFAKALWREHLWPEVTRQTADEDCCWEDATEVIGKTYSGEVQEPLRWEDTWAAPEAPAAPALLPLSGL